MKQYKYGWMEYLIGDYGSGGEMNIERHGTGITAVPLAATHRVVTLRSDSRTGSPCDGNEPLNFRE